MFFGAADGHYAGVSFSSWLNKGVTRMFCRQLILDIKEPVEKHIKTLNDFQPEILGGYFTGLKILAEKQEKGELRIKPEFIVNCGEGFNPKEKEYVESVFKLPLVNVYGFAESMIAGIGKDEYDGIYLFDDIVYIEIKDDHILVTNLFNKTQPLIRYRIDDYPRLKKDEHRRLPYTLVDTVVGREEMVIWLRNDKGALDFIHPIVIAEFYVKGLDKLQIVLKDEYSFDFLAVINQEDKDEVVKKIKEKLDGILSAKQFNKVRYEVKVVDKLSVDKKTGKFKLIVKQ